jgi:hypothetical protein
MDNWLVVGIGFAALLQAVGHWFPAKMPLLGRYVYGTSAILIGFIIWRGMAGDWASIAGLLAIAAASGFTVWACYRIDAVVLAIRQAKRAERDSDELP